jgi:hypothetical protein
MFRVTDSRRISRESTPVRVRNFFLPYVHKAKIRGEFSSFEDRENRDEKIPNLPLIPIRSKNRKGLISCIPSPLSD